MSQVHEVNKIIELNSRSNIRFTIEKLYYEENVRNGKRGIEEALIILKDNKSGKNIVHPFTEFLLDTYLNASIKTKIDYGRKITAFLNYILDNTKRLQINNFSELTFEIGSRFLNEYCGLLQRETVKEYKSKLAQFYYYLTKKGILKHCKLSDFTVGMKVLWNGVPKKYIIAPFPKVRLPENKPEKRNEHEMSYELQAIFLEVAFEEVNRIALGVALGIFGGLRVSEIVRCRYSLIRTVGQWGEHGLIISLKDDDLGTRPDLLNNQGKGYVKRPRLQEVLSPFGITGELFKRHKIRYKAKDGSDALFINDDGKAMSYASYQYYFSVLKRKFIQRLKESKNPLLKAQALTLSSKRWSTHICRGIFSNNLVEMVDNPSVVAIKRGDKNINSVLPYIADSRRISKKYEENAENLYGNLLNKLNLNK